MLGSPVSPGQCSCTEVCCCNGCCDCGWLITLQVHHGWKSPGGGGGGGVMILYFVVPKDALLFFYHQPNFLTLCHIDKPSSIKLTMYDICIFCPPPPHITFIYLFIYLFQIFIQGCLFSQRLVFHRALCHKIQSEIR